MDEAGTVLPGTPTLPATPINGTYDRYSLNGTAPVSTAKMRIYAGRLINNSGAAAALWLEVDNAQLQEGEVATNFNFPNVDPATKLDATATAAAATKLATARAVSLTGVVTAAGVNFDGTGNLQLTTAIANGALSIPMVANLQSSLDGKQATLGFTPENAANRGVAGGYAPLDSNGQIPAIHLPGSMDDVLEYASRANFPATGVSGVLYLAVDTNHAWRWSGTTYVEITASPGSTDSVPEGSANKYFTDARAQAAMTGAISTVVTANLTANRVAVLDANGKFTVSAVTTTELGYVSGASSNLQQQINGKLGSTATAVAATKLETARAINGVNFDGTAAISINLNNAVTFNNGGSGAASGSTFNGSGAVTISYNTIGAGGLGASNSWTGINTFTKMVNANPSAMGVQQGHYAYQQGGVQLWVTGVETNRAFKLWSYSDTGSFLNTVFDIARDAQTLTGSSTGWSLAGSQIWTAGNLPVSESAGNGTVVKRTANGYVYANYINTTADVTATSPSHVTVMTGSDSFLRHQTFAQFGANLRAQSGPSADISTDYQVAKYLRWKNYGNGHTIIDASQGTSPSGSAINNTTPQIGWSATYPTLMGWNGANTYGVRVYISNFADALSNDTAIVGAGRLYSGYDSGVTGSISCSQWFRTTGNTGIYFASYAIGLYATDATYVRTYNNAKMAAADFVISSDRRLKAGIRPFEFKGRLRPVKYIYRSNGEWDIGFIAQEVMAMYPELVGKIDATGMYQLSYQKVTVVLSYQINRLEDEHEKLKVEHEELKDRFNQLEALVMARLNRPTLWQRLLRLFGRK